MGRWFIAAGFQHASSRADDPLLHTHVVVGNLTLGPDGKWTALDARHLYRQAKAGGYLYQAELRREITERLGLEFGPVEEGCADLVGFSRSVIEHFSRRQEEMREHMAEHGGHSARSAQIAVLETRRVKNDLALQVHRERWIARAQEHGLDGPAVDRILEAGEQNRQLTLDTGTPQVGRIVEDVLTAKKSTFGRPELIQALAAAQPQGASVADLERLANHVLQHREIVPLPVGKAPAGLKEPRFTTREMLAIEQDLLDRATDALTETLAFVPSYMVEKACENRTLSPEQREVVDRLCSDGDGVAVVRAPAGTGKTFVLDAAREAWQERRIQTVGCALSARAALELSDQAAIASLTIAQLRHRLESGEQLPRGGVLVVDEAGMVGTRDLAALANAAQEARAKLVLVGDDRQLPELEAGGAFHALAERLPACELHEVRRHREAWDRAALDQLRSGEVEKWARAYRDHGQITVGESNDATRDALVNDWALAGGETLMIAARREDVRDLNQRARARLRAEGRLPSQEVETAGRAFAVGNRVIGTHNDRRAGILNGQRGTVVHAEPGTGQLTVHLAGDRLVDLGPDYLEAGHLDHGYAITAHRAQGATVDRTFVLGGEELYREWSYTAMSRHRDQARFYVTGHDIAPNRELPPPQDPVVDGISRLVDRREVQELAIDSLPAAERTELERERRELRQRLAANPPPERSPRREEHQEGQEGQIHYRLQVARDYQERLRAERENTSWHQRSARSQLDQRIAGYAQDEHRAGEQLNALHAIRHAADGRDQAWLKTHGLDAAQLLAIRSELHTRDTADRRADHALQALHRDPLPAPELTQDLGLDFGL